MPPILHLTLFHPADDHYGLSPMEAAGDRARYPQRGRRMEQGAARQCGAAFRRARLCGPDAALTDAQFDRLKSELETNYQGARQCGPAAAAGRRARLEAVVAVAEGHGFRRSESRRRARDRARLRRAAAAARPAGRQHACQLRRSQPRLLPPDHHPAGEAHREALAQWLRRLLATRCTRSPISTPSRPCRQSAKASGAASPAAGFLSDDEKREAVGYGRAG